MNGWENPDEWDMDDMKRLYEEYSDKERKRQTPVEIYGGSIVDKLYWDSCLGPMYISMGGVYPLKEKYREYVLTYQRKLNELENTEEYKKVVEEYRKYRAVMDECPIYKLRDVEDIELLDNETKDELDKLYLHPKRRIREIDEDMGKLEDMFKDNVSLLDTFNKAPREGNMRTWDDILWVKAVKKLRLLMKVIIGSGSILSLLGYSVYKVVSSKVPIMKGVVMERLEDTNRYVNS